MYLYGLYTSSPSYCSLFAYTNSGPYSRKVSSWSLSPSLTPRSFSGVPKCRRMRRTSWKYSCSPLQMVWSLFSLSSHGVVLDKKRVIYGPSNADFTRRSNSSFLSSLSWLTCRLRCVNIGFMMTHILWCAVTLSGVCGWLALLIFSFHSILNVSLGIV